MSYLTHNDEQCIEVRNASRRCALDCKRKGMSHRDECVHELQRQVFHLRSPGRSIRCGHSARELWRTTGYLGREPLDNWQVGQPSNSILNGRQRLQRRSARDTTRTTGKRVRTATALRAKGRRAVPHPKLNDHRGFLSSCIGGLVLYRPVLPCSTLKAPRLAVTVWYYVQVVSPRSTRQNCFRPKYRACCRSTLRSATRSFECREHKCTHEMRKRDGSKRAQ